MEKVKKKVLYVGDHRDSMNWGGRGQSIAFYQLLSQDYQISDVISGLDVLSVESDDGYIETILPQKYIRFLYRIREKTKVADWYLRLEEKFGAQDFVTDDPEKSLSNLLKNKDKAPGLGEIYDKVKNAEIIVINGEGSGVFRTPFRRDFFFYLMIAELGKHLGKKVFYANGILSDCPKTGRNKENFESARKTLAKCDAVLVRDPESYDLVVKEMPGVACHYVPDALFTWASYYEKPETCLPANGDFLIAPPEEDRYFGKLDFSKPYICVGGSASAADDQDRAFQVYSRIFERLQELGSPVYLTPNCGGDRFFGRIAERYNVGILPLTTPILMCGAVAANARLFVSGRFHATIFASLGGTPCLFLGTHSHKMASLNRTLNYEEKKMFPAFPSEEQMEEMLALGRRYLEEGEERRKKIKKEVARLDAETRKMNELIAGYL